MQIGKQLEATVVFKHHRLMDTFVGQMGMEPLTGIIRRRWRVQRWRQQLIAQMNIVRP